MIKKSLFYTLFIASRLFSMDLNKPQIFSTSPYQPSAPETTKKKEEKISYTINTIIERIRQVHFKNTSHAQRTNKHLGGINNALAAKEKSPKKSAPLEQIEDISPEDIQPLWEHFTTTQTMPPASYLNKLAEFAPIYKNLNQANNSLHRKNEVLVKKLEYQQAQNDAMKERITSMSLQYHGDTLQQLSQTLREKEELLKTQEKQWQDKVSRQEEEFKAQLKNIKKVV